MSAAQTNSATTTFSAQRSQVPWGKYSLRLTAFLYLGIMVVLPLATIIQNGLSDGLRAFWGDVTNVTAFSALKLTVTSSAIVTLINAAMGTLTAYVLVRYRFPGKGLFNWLIDLPLAIATL